MTAAFLLDIGLQRVVDIAAPIIRDEMLKPHDLVPEDVPIVVKETGRLELAATFFNNNVEQRPTHIDITDAPTKINERDWAELNVYEYLGVLAHEMVHASLWRNTEENTAHGGHGPTFAESVRAIGLTNLSPTFARDGLKWRLFVDSFIMPELLKAAGLTEVPWKTPLPMKKELPAPSLREMLNLIFRPSSDAIEATRLELGLPSGSDSDPPGLTVISGSMLNAGKSKSPAAPTTPTTGPEASEPASSPSAPETSG